jgi:glutaredoxin
MALHKVTIYGKPDCKLCDAAEETVRKVVANNVTILIEKIDITQDTALLEKYRNDIPVIAVDGVEHFRHTVDPDKLAQLFYSELGGNLVGFGG